MAVAVSAMRIQRGNAPTAGFRFSGCGCDTLPARLFRIKISIILFSRDAMPYAAARVGRVAVVARDHMDMRVENRLPGAAPAVEPDVDAGRMVTVQQILPHPLHQLPAGGLLFRLHQEITNLKQFLDMNCRNILNS